MIGTLLCAVETADEALRWLESGLDYIYELESPGWKDVAEYKQNLEDALKLLQHAVPKGLLEEYQNAVSYYDELSDHYEAIECL